MKRELAALGAAFAVQAAAVAAVPVHETWLRSQGADVTLAVQPVDPYDPMRGYGLSFTYRGIDRRLPGFDAGAASGAVAYVVLAPGAIPGQPARPVRLIDHLPAPRGTVPLRVRYLREGFCAPGRGSQDACLTITARPDTWYLDERRRDVFARALKDDRAVADLRITSHGEGSLLRLRLAPSAGTMGLKR
jgi:GDYXXLXY motif protein